MRRILALAFAMFFVPQSAFADATVVFSEIMYHPFADEPDLEWIELESQMAVDMDLGGWSLTGGIFFEFPEGTILEGGDRMVVASSPNGLAAESGYVGAFGPFERRLSNSGERLELRDNSDRVVSTVRYGVGGAWPVAPDGSGVSLAKLRPTAGCELAENWAPSREVGGTPGRLNFPSDDLPPEIDAQGLVSYWSLDESSGTLRDVAGGNDGTPGSGNARVAGIVGEGAISFDNTTDSFINIGNGVNDNFSVTAGITVEALIVPEWSGALDDYDDIFRKEDGSRRILLAFQHDGTTETRDVAITPSTQPVLSFGINVDGVYSELDMPLDGAEGRPTLAGLKDGAAHHIAATYNGATGAKRIYVDGDLAFEADLGAGNTVESGGVATAYIGNMSGRREPFTGIIDEVAIWERALSAAEVSTHSAAAERGEDYFSQPTVTGGDYQIAFNEIRVSGDAGAFVELVSTSNAAQPLEGFVLSMQGLVDAEVEITGGTLEAGGYVVFDAEDLGFDLEPDHRLFLYGPDGTAVPDAVRLRDGLRGRFPEADGRWLFPNRETPGAENSFAFREEIVINEIMYHRRPLLATPAVIEDTLLLEIDATWSYDESGDGHATSAWAQPDFDDIAWDVGPGIFFQEDSDLPAPKNTELTIGQITYYFRTTFEFDDDPEGVQLSLRPIVDDGAVFYLNGVEIHRLNMGTGAIGPDTLATGAVSNARFQGPFRVDAPTLVRGTNTIAVEVHQRTANSSDVVMGLELSASVTLEPAQPFRESPEAWIELYNRSGSEVSLSGWGLRGGLRYDFTPGTSIGAGGYLLVAADSAFLASVYPELDIVGDYEGRLSHRDDVVRLDDAFGNPADEVHYYDDGRWPRYADGGGSSLELRHPDADNSSPEAWAASDETDATEWRTYSYTAIARANIGPTQWREFVLGLLDDGEILIDDIRAIESPSSNPRDLFTNGDFESGDDDWRILGNHRHSAVIQDPDNPANHVLHLVATGATEHMHNHLERTLVTSVVNGREYEIRFRARWLAGSNQVNTRLYFNRVPQTTLLDMPDTFGTPGARNSVYEDAVGPSFDDLAHAPPIPDAGESVTVSISAWDEDGIADMTLWYSVHGGAWTSRSMNEDDPGRYSASIPGQSSGRVVQFYVEGTDASGNIEWFPAAGRDSRALYRVQDGQARLGTIHNLRIVMTPADESLLYQTINVMSNERLGATAYWDEREVTYDVGVRLKGSERGRPTSNRVSFNVRYPRHQLFRDVHRTVSIDRSGGWSGRGGRQDEIVLKHISNKAGGIPGMYDDICRVIAPRSTHTSSALLMMAKYNDEFLETAYEDGEDGTKFKFDLIYYPTTANAQGYKLPQPDGVLGADNANHGDDHEVYRWNWIIRDHRDRDDYSALVRWCQSMSSSSSVLAAATEETMDVEQFLRAFAMYALGGVNDTYTFGNNHNNQYYHRPSDDKILVFPWDMDFCWHRGTNSSLIGDQNLGRVIRLPPNLRRFWGHMQDIIDRAYNPSYMSRWTTHYGQLAGQNYGGVLDYIRARRTFALSQIPRPVSFAITTNDGDDFTVDTSTVVLEGNAGIDVQQIIIGERVEIPEVSWSSISQWEMEVPLLSGPNELLLLGFDVNGDFSDSESITVTSTFDFPAPTLTALIPSTAAPGELVTITGTGFAFGIEVFFGETAADVQFDPANPSRLDVVVPNIAAGAVDVTARNSGSDASNALPFTVAATTPLFVRSDANLDGNVDLSDAIAVLLFLFGGQSIGCEDAADVNDDEQIQITDAILVLGYLFQGGEAPAAPFPMAGRDPDDAGPLGCEVGLLR